MTPADESAAVKRVMQYRLDPGDLAQAITDELRAAVAAERERGKKCICKGNWQKIVSDSEGMIGKQFYNENGDRFTFFGVVHGDDDYYYGMFGKSGLRLLSCVSGINGHGFEAAIREGTK